MHLAFWERNKRVRTLVFLHSKSSGGKLISSTVELSVEGKFMKRSVTILMTFDMGASMFAKPFSTNGSDLK